GILLRLQGFAQAGADSVDDDLLKVVRLRIGGSGALLRLHGGIAPEQCHGDRRTDQRRPCDSHDWLTLGVSSFTRCRELRRCIPPAGLLKRRSTPLRGGRPTTGTSYVPI